MKLVNTLTRRVVDISICMAVTIFTGCAAGDEIDFTYLTSGKWDESYDDQNFCMDGSVVYEFKGTESCGIYTLTTCSYLEPMACESIHKGSYFVRDGYIFLSADSTRSDIPATGYKYKIIMLTAREMAWQKDSTKYSKGTIGGDYRHFIKSE